MTNISYGILELLHQHGEIRGTEKLAQMLGTHIGNKGRVFSAAMMLARFGLIEMQLSRGGRGVRTIYRDKGILRPERNL